MIKRLGGRGGATDAVRKAIGYAHDKLKVSMPKLDEHLELCLRKKRGRRLHTSRHRTHNAGTPTGRSRTRGTSGLTKD